MSIDELQSSLVVHKKSLKKPIELVSKRSTLKVVKEKEHIGVEDYLNWKLHLSIVQIVSLAHNIAGMLVTYRLQVSKYMLGKRTEIMRAAV
ncbi:hypothetical protein CR513_57320, partial [Mucuna pruriens]